MNILITGATGFVGSHLAELLYQKGHDLFLLVRNPRKARQFNLQGNFIQGDLSENSIQEWTQKLPKELDLIIHTAGIVHSFSDKDFSTINTKASLNLFMTLEKLYPSLKIIFISSLAAFGPTPLECQTLTEASDQKPVSKYGHSKKEVEDFLKSRYQKRSLIINPPMVIGPRDVAVLDIFKMVRDRLVLVAGLDGLEKEYSFINVFDLVAFIEASIEKNLNGQFFVSHPKVITTNDLISTISYQMQKKPLILKIPNPLLKILVNTLALINKVAPLSIRLTPDKLNELGPKRWVCDGTQASKTYCYQWDLEKTVEVTLKDYLNRQWL